MTFNSDLPVQTRDGRKARIICDDMDNVSYPIAAIVVGVDGLEVPDGFTQDGHHSYEEMEDGIGSSHDLINIPEKPKTYWVNIYPKTLSGPEQFLIYGAGKYTKLEADDIARLDRIACLEFTEGDGL